MIVLGIETSCDETAAAVVRAEAPPEHRVLSDLVLSQLDDHAPYGGVVPEIAARAHVLHLDGLVRRAMNEAGLGFADLDAVAATAGPGLLSGLLVGLMTGKAIAAAAAKPFIAVNHLEGHALSARLVADVRFPFLLLLVSGGHCQLLSVEDVGRYVRLGTTLDDAAGEAFDKTAKLLGLGFPGGAAIERLAQGGDERRFPLPRPMLGQPGCDFSFSGLKTAVRHALATLGRPPTAAESADLAASFQAAAVASLVDRAGHAMTWYAHRHPAALRLVAAGGVAANGALKAGLAALCAARGFTLFVPPPKFCTDNGAMIAWAGAERLGRGLVDGLDAGARARWPLDPDAEPKPFAGVKA